MELKVYHEIFKSKSDLENEFNIKLTDEKILFAYYSDEDYSGEAFILFLKGGKLYEVNGSHCSCYGLEGQWEPEEVVLDELIHRTKKGYVCGYDHKSEDNELSKTLEYLKQTYV